ncbi:MAG: Rieske 2Fe-2S domain-containing protein [Pseudomonadota bacterium]
MITRSLDARYYTDPAVFEDERDGILARTWQFACHASDIPDPGDYTTFEIAGESLFCIRGRDGQLRTFYNVCQHRAHQLVQGSGSTRVVVCPYHAWTYELTGQLRAGPNLNAVDGFDKSGICLSQVSTEDFLGFVFVNLDPDAEPMEHWFPGARAELAEWVPHHGQLKPLEWVEIAERCNWKVSVENYSECYHCSLNYLASTGMVDFHAIPRPGSSPIDDLAWADKRDVLIAITCKPYRAEVVETVHLARAQGMTIIALSDSPASPIIRAADHGFLVAADTPQFFPSSVSTIALLETLLSFVIAVASPEIVQRVETFHARRHRLGIYAEEAT